MTVKLVPRLLKRISQASYLTLLGPARGCQTGSCSKQSNENANTMSSGRPSFFIGDLGSNFRRKKCGYFENPALFFHLQELQDISIFWIRCTSLVLCVHYRIRVSSNVPLVSPQWPTNQVLICFHIIY